MLEKPCVQYETELAENNLLAPEEMKEAAARLWWIGSAIILGLGGYKLWVALTKGHHNVAFLCILGLVGVVCSGRRLLRPVAAHQPVWARRISSG